jgi:hypothetical protein
MNRKRIIALIAIPVWLIAAASFGFFHHNQLRPSNDAPNPYLTLVGLFVGLGFLCLMWFIRKRQK